VVEMSIDQVHKYYINFHTATYHWMSEWREKSWFLGKDGKHISVAMRIKDKQAQVGFTGLDGKPLWVKLNFLDLAVRCLDDEDGEHVVKVKLVKCVNPE